MIILFKYYADVKNCESFRDFGFLFFLIFLFYNNNNNNGLTIIKIKNSYTKHESLMQSFYPIILGEYLN